MEKVTKSELGVSSEVITQEVEKLLSALGREPTEGSIAYDTAWLARLAIRFPNYGFDDALLWLRRNQHADGSWGSDALHYHDRMISTLSAINALKTIRPTVSDEKRIQRGESFLWHHYKRLHWDANDTVNFSGLASMLVSEAEVLGLHVPPDLYPKRNATEKKLAKLRAQPERWVGHPLTLSLEFLEIGLPEGAQFVDARGSVGASPAATASLLLHSDIVDWRALDYLQSIVLPDGGAPNFEPLDIFDAAYSLNHLMLTNAVSPDHPEVRRCLDFLWEMWLPEKGLGCSSYTKAVVDLDDTAVGFAVLHWGGYPVSADVFAWYEDVDYFRCYPDETDQSLIVHLRTLAALQRVKTHPQYEVWTQKIIAFFQRYNESGQLKSDKWHASHYYLSGAAIQHLQGICDDLIQPHVDWIKKTQRADGGWGVFQTSTPEETSYALQALLHWHRYVTPVDWDQIEAASTYLSGHLYDQDFTPMWIAKALHTPTHVIRASILSALHTYLTHGDA